MIPRFTPIVPFCVPAAEAADDACRQLTSPGLERLLARAREAECERHDDAYPPTLPYECRLAKYAGLPISPLSSAPYMRLADGSTADTRTWVYLQPVHIHATRDHLAMFDPAQLCLEAADADALRVAITLLADEMGTMLDAMHATRWYVADLSFGNLTTTVPQRATGRNIDIWMYKGEQECAWRKFQNEIQMTWYDHPVNQVREARGPLPVNSVWLFDQGVLVDARFIVEHMTGTDPFFAGLCHTGHATELCVETLAVVPFGNTSIAVPLGDAGKPYLSANWYDWIETLCAHDRDWFSPTADALADGRTDAASLVLTGDSHYAHCRVIRRELVIDPFGWLCRFSYPRTLCDALFLLSMAA